jgi:nucleoside recognition membrane protein YjiH
MSIDPKSIIYIMFPIITMITICQGIWGSGEDNGKTTGFVFLVFCVIALMFMVMYMEGKN